MGAGTSVEDVGWETLREGVTYLEYGVDDDARTIETL